VGVSENDSQKAHKVGRVLSQDSDITKFLPECFFLNFFYFFFKQEQKFKLAEEFLS